MKLNKFFMGIAVAAASMASVGCSDDFDRPPVITPVADIEANTTILELKEQYYQSGSDYITEIGLTPDGDHIIIGGRVVSSDEEGNVYQRIIIEDETAAIPVRVYTTKLFETYHYGQEVFIDVTGMQIGTYRGWLMIGAEYNGSIGGMDKELMAERAQVNGLPNANKIAEYVVTIPDVVGFKSNDTEFMTWQSRLITLENVTFVNGGKDTWGTVGANNYTTRQLRDADGNTIDISTSNKCNFTGTTMPTGTGTVKAILSYFGSNWQLVFSNPETDCIGFDEPSEGPDTPDTPVDAATSISADFENNTLPDGWTETTTSGNRNWLVKEFNGNHYVQCSAYKGTAGSEGFKSWLITAPVNFDGMTKKTMSFQSEIQYTGDSNLQLFVMTTADPKTAEMTELTFTKPEPNENGSSTGYLFSGEISLEQFKGVGYIAWLYTASDPNASRTYRVDNVKIGMSADSQPETPDTPTTGKVLYSALAEADASTDWNLDAAIGVWTWKEYQSNHYLNASAFGNDAAIGKDSYAFSPVIDLSAAKSAKLTFDHAAKFQTTLRTLCGLAVRVEGATDWTAVAIPTWPEPGAWKFVSSGEIDLSAYAGKKIQVAFKYGSSAEGADTWEIKNLKITE